MLTVIKRRNQTPQGIWYLVDIKGHHLNLLSESELKEGETLEIEKQSPLLLKVVRPVDAHEQKPGAASSPDTKTLDLLG